MDNPIIGATAPAVFSFDQSFNIRVIMIDDDPWFYAVDVCAALGIDATQVRKLDDDEITQVIDPDTLHSIQGKGINNLVNVISESGLYTMILRCRDATKAGTVPHKFRKWVTSEVLPSIRKTGRYQVTAEPAPVLDRINSAQQHQLGHIVRIIGMNFHMDGQAAHAAYANVRKSFGLEKGVSNLPTIYYDQAIQILTELERLSFTFKGIVIEQEQAFFRHMMRGCKPFDRAAAEEAFAAEMAKLFDDHAKMLKLLN